MHDYTPPAGTERAEERDLFHFLSFVSQTLIRVNILNNAHSVDLQGKLAHLCVVGMVVDLDEAAPTVLLVVLEQLCHLGQDLACLREAGPS